MFARLGDLFYLCCINSQTKKTMNKKQSTLMMLAAAMAISEQQPTRLPEKESPEERKKRLIEAEKNRFKAQGLTEFFYGENSLWALNQKSADKKARLRQWI
jgi:hypothetical protein